MVKKILFLLAAVSLLAVFSCSKGGSDETPFLKFDSPAEVSLGATDGMAILKINSNTGWKITGTPSWCTPSASSGTGSATVDFIIESNMDAGGRTASMQVESGAGKLPFTISQAGKANLYAEGEWRVAEKNRETNPVNIVIMGDGFTDEDMTKGGAYDKAMDRARNAYFEIEPYRTFRNYFNIYYVYARSRDRGATYGYGYDGSTEGSYRTQKRVTAFSSTMSTTYGDTGISCDYDKVFEYARKIPAIYQGDDLQAALKNPDNTINKTVVIVVINDTRYAGTCLFYSSGACIGMCPMSTRPGNTSFEATLRHEVGGHGFAKFSDEYVYSADQKIPDADAKSLAQWQGFGMQLNLSLSMDKASAPDTWKPFLGNADYPEVGFFEGGSTYGKGVWHAEHDKNYLNPYAPDKSGSIMNDNRNYYNGPQAYNIYMRIKQIAKEDVTWAGFVAIDAARKAEGQKAMAAALMTRSAQPFVPLGRPVMVNNR